MKFIYTALIITFMRFWFLPIIMILLLALPACAADFNPKSITEIEVSIIKSGTIDATGIIDTLNLSLYLPQDGIKSIKVSPDTWSYGQDEFGNKMIVISWERPSGKLSYRLEMDVENSASYLYEKKQIGSNPFYLKETEKIVFSDDIRKFAYPYDKTLDRVAELVMAVNNMVEYDASFAGEDKPSSWVMQNKRGVCVEFDNLLTALLRVSGIPTRYIVGYTYSNKDSKFMGHSWVEVLASDNSWISFDPTWLQGGYLDATHIKTAAMLENNQTETLYYIGRGSVDWKKNEDVVDIVDYTTGDITDISVFSEDFTKNSAGYLKADISTDGCMITDITASSCVDSNEKKMLNIYENEREIWFCNRDEVYWIFDIAESASSYACPVLVYDQTGAETSRSIRISGEKQIREVFISGPDSAGVNDPFILEASADGIFFSSGFGRSSSRNWELNARIPGSYNFYLYSDGAIAAKTVDVIEEKEFSVSVSAPNNVTLSSFLVNVTVKNLLSKSKTATIRIDFSSQIHEKELSFAPKESKTLVFNLTAIEPGIKTLTASAMSDSISSYSTSVMVQKPYSFDILELIISFFSSIIDSIRNLFVS